MTNAMKNILLILGIILALIIKVFAIGTEYKEDSNIALKILNGAKKPTPIPQEVIEINTLKAQLVSANANVEQLRIELSSRNADINRAKVLKQSTISVLNRNITGKLQNKGEIIYQASLKYNLNPVLQTSIMMQETGCGTDRNSSLYSHNNVGGVFTDRGLKYYNNVDDAIYDMANILRTHYIDKGLLTINNIGKKYCPIGAKNDPTGLNKHWIPSVTKNYNKLTEEIDYEIQKNTKQN